MSVSSNESDMRAQAKATAMTFEAKAKAYHHCVPVSIGVSPATRS